MTAAATAIARGRAWLEHAVGGAEEQARVARRIVVASGAVLVLSTVVLVGDYAVSVWREAGQTARIVEMEGQTKEDAEMAALLHEERKGHTDGTLARETRGRALAWVLLLAGAVFVGGGKWAASLRPERHPSLEELVAVRFGEVAGAGGQGAGPAGTGVREQEAGEQRSGSAGEGTGGGQGYVAPETIDLAFVDDLIGRFGRDKESAIPILQGIQEHYRYLPDEALRRVCETTEITPAQIAGTSSFYSQFRRSPVGRHVVKVCHGTACHVAGAEQITEELRRHLDIPPGEDTDARRLFTLDKVACVGCCSLAPVMMIEEDTAGRLTPTSARQVLDAVEKKG
jgi:NADH:ubiquinone oxidoreductase subunit E